MSSVRLDNYVYTVESFKSAREASPDGTLIAYHMSGFAHRSEDLPDDRRGVREAARRVRRFHYLFNYTFVAGAGAATMPRRPVGEALNQPVERSHDDWPYSTSRARWCRRPHRRAAMLLTVLFVGAVRTHAAWRMDGAMFLGVGFCSWRPRA
jgi:hypothetical protein